MNYEAPGVAFIKVYITTVNKSMSISPSPSVHPRNVDNIYISIC